MIRPIIVHYFQPTIAEKPFHTDLPAADRFLSAENSEPGIFA